MAENQDAPSEAHDNKASATVARTTDDASSEDSATEMNVGEKTPTLEQQKQQHNKPHDDPTSEKVHAEDEVTKSEAAAQVDSKTSNNISGLDDDNVVFWDGDDDPQNPYNWKTWVKVFNCVLISALTFVTPLASCMFFLACDVLFFCIGDWKRILMKKQ
ncbi:hypothetical protein NQ176_g2183 [Zarea fungicola]|uniref:Uncharacterized protein n=1 Tax=Zarea fungicola TaxID=93591 RepID=A0ACC1NPD6_9HYPO|nr:hypothetical protein NQ176_g2183 [Lecanicillium fungicola]